MSTPRALVLIAASFFLGATVASMAAGPNEPPALLTLYNVDELATPPLILNVKEPRQAFSGGQGAFSKEQIAILKDLVRQGNTKDRKLFEQLANAVKDLAQQQNRINSAVFEGMR